MRVGGFAVQPLVIGGVGFQKNDAAVERDRVEHYGQASASLVRVGLPDARPDDLFASRDAFCRVGDENGVGGLA